MRRVHRVHHVPGGPLALVLLLSACASGGAPPAGAVYGSATAQQAVQDFLEAAKRDDYRTMGQLFGTENGPAEKKLGRTEVEQRMFVLAAFLEHRAFAVRRSGLTEGPNRIRFLADLAGTRNGDVTVPIIAVAHRDRWYVERVVTDPLTRSTG